MTTLVDLFSLTLTRLQGMINTPVFDSQPSGRPPQYVQLIGSGGNIPVDRLSGQRMIEWPCYPMCVGLDQWAALNALDQVDNRMIGWDPIPGNLSAARVERDETYPPVVPYRSVEGDERYSITPTYRLVLDW